MRFIEIFAPAAFTSTTGPAVTERCGDTVLAPGEYSSESRVTVASSRLAFWYFIRILSTPVVTRCRVSCCHFGIRIQCQGLALIICRSVSTWPSLLTAGGAKRARRRAVMVELLLTSCVRRLYSRSESTWLL